MTVWQFLDKTLERLPGWPSERQVVAIVTYAMGLSMLVMARNDAKLWNVELFKTLITVVIVTGCINMILAFHYAANKGDETKSANTAKAFEAMKAVGEAATAAASGTPGAGGDLIGKAADAVADAATDKAQEIKGDDA